MQDVLAAAQGNSYDVPETLPAVFPGTKRCDRVFPHRNHNGVRSRFQLDDMKTLTWTLLKLAMGGARNTALSTIDRAHSWRSIRGLASRTDPGPRQSGKTTLAHFACAPNYLAWQGERPTAGGNHLNWAYFRQHRDYKCVTLDDPAARDGARDDPMGFVAALPERVILDEVQRAPELFGAIKLAVDRRRVPGRILMTGSSYVLPVPQLSEPLAGRRQIVRLHPLAQVELEGQSLTPKQPSGFLGALFGDGFRVSQSERLAVRLVEKVVAGGFPPALAAPTERRRANWYRNYIETLIQRDVRDMSRIRSLDILPRLLSAAASQTAQLFNLSDLASHFELTRPAIGTYLTLLERLFLLDRLPA